jgi:hypothetical protein
MCRINPNKILNFLSEIFADIRHKFDDARVVLMLQSISVDVI